MSLNISLKNISPLVKPEIEEYIAMRTDQLMKYISAPEESVKIKAVISFEKNHTVYKYHLTVTIKQGKEEVFVGEETKHTHTEAIDAVHDIVKLQILKAHDKKINH